jgi:signal transduction histidine kinase
MLTGTRLYDLANSAGQLLDCEQVSLCLFCPEVTLRHPLIALFFEMYGSSPLYYGSFLDPMFLSHAICDSALLTGQNLMERAWLKRIREEYRVIGSVMIAVLERPAGIVGFLFCASQHEKAFSEGERLLLAQYAPELARQVEQIVSESCLTSPTQASVENNATGMQEQSAFLSLISHELRAPLTAIKGYAGLLQAYGSNERQPEKMSGAQQLRYLDVIMEQVNHLEVLIGDVLDVSHIQSGCLALRCTSVDLGSLCQHVVQLMQYRVDQQQPGQYCILCRIDPELPLVWADADRVQQVLTNLVENAIKYSPDGGLVEIQVCGAANCSRHCTCMYRVQKQGALEKYSSFDAPFVCVTVSDQGIGIPPQQHSSLFKLFTRLEHPATRNVSGSGLGLYIARKLVEAMHGQVLLRSSEGKGTDITFSLPVAHVASVFPQAHSKKQPFFQAAPTH